MAPILCGSRRMLRQPTRWTRPLQIGFAFYLIVFILVGWILLVRPISSAVTGGDTFRAWVLASSWTVWTLIGGLLTLGSIRTWRWAFWAYLGFLVFIILASVIGPNRTTIAVLSALIYGGIAVVLLTVAVIGLVRFGPWAMTKVEPVKEAGSKT